MNSDVSNISFGFKKAQRQYAMNSLPSINQEPKTSGSFMSNMAGTIRRFGTRLNRTKVIDLSAMDTNLRRCLTTADIALLGIGHMVGSGVYVLSSTVAKNLAGPAIIVAFLLSGFASFLAALCYAELGVRYPKSGSAYSYTYLSLGELWAFLVGWNVTLEHVIGLAAVARACSAYIDSLVGDVIRNATEAAIGHIHLSLFADRLDFLALFIVILFTIGLSFGVRLTSLFNNILSAINMTVLVIIVGVGAYFADINNWTNPKTNGFMPYGWSGVLAASASCFYAYTGFDSIASSGEEAKDPQKSIPRATMIAMGIATTAYVSVSTVLTLMVNYKSLNDEAGLPDALAARGAVWAKYIVVIGAVCGMMTAIIGSLFALTRVIYAMADDGLLFKIFSVVNEKTKIPLYAMYIFASLAALMSFTLDVATLVEVMSIGTLFAYLVVSASVIILRYRPMQRQILSSNSQELSSIGDNSPSSVDKSPDFVADSSGQFREKFYSLHSFINFAPGRLVCICVLVMAVMMFILCIFLKIFMAELQVGSFYFAIILVLLAFGAATPLVIIFMHQQSTIPLPYKVPFVPFVPALSVFINTLLITNLKTATWIRLVLWVAIGLSLYFFYGYRHSKLNEQTLSPKSSLLGPTTTQPPPTWGSLEKELPSSPPDEKQGHDSGNHSNAVVQSSSSTEILVDSMEKH